jgi:hypothetical protein
MMRLIPSCGFISQNHMALAVMMVMIGKMMMKAIAPLTKNMNMTARVTT